MDHKFMDVDKKRRDKLINAGYTEYSIHGKKRASLNKILSKSGFSKGVFYYYFKDKEGFYEFLLDYGVTYILNEFEKVSLLEVSDFIIRIVENYIAKAIVFKKYKHFSNFLSLAYKDMEKIEDMGYVNKKSNDFAQRFLTENIDYSLYRIPNDSANAAITGRYLNSLFMEIIDRLDDMSIEQIKTYLYDGAKPLRHVLYKEEYHD